MALNWTKLLCGFHIPEKELSWFPNIFGMDTKSYRRWYYDIHPNVYTIFVFDVVIMYGVAVVLT